MNEVQSFILENVGIRGTLVRLEETWQKVIAAHDYTCIHAFGAYKDYRLFDIKDALGIN